MSEENNDPYTYDEKLKLVADGLMDPKEIGLASAEEAAKLEVMPDAEINPILGDPINFKASEVPLQLRALWASQESKIAPFDQQAWMEQHKDEHVIQGEIRSGNMVGRLERTVTDPIDGFILLMQDALEQLLKVRAKMKAGVHEVAEETPATATGSKDAS